MPTAYSSKDLNRLFDGKVLTRGRTLLLFGAVDVALDGDTIRATIDQMGTSQTAQVTPAKLGDRTVFDSRCTCNMPHCVHLAAGMLAALDKFPQLRAAEAAPSLLDRVVAGPPAEKRRLLIELAPVGDRGTRFPAPAR